jgi:hypothetical protein
MATVTNTRVTTQTISLVEEDVGTLTIVFSGGSGGTVTVTLDNGTGGTEVEFTAEAFAKFEQELRKP